MSILGNTTKKEEKEKSEKRKSVEVAEKNKKEKGENQNSTEQAISQAPQALKLGSGAYKVLVRPHVTEKAAFLAEENKYIFEVAEDSNKIMIKQAVENVYGVNVESVNIVKVPGKERRVGRRIGFKKGYKKAIVRLKEGQQIEIIPR